MHVVSRPKLIEFWEKHKDAETPLRVWFKKVRQAKWKSVNDLKKDFASADYVGDNPPLSVASATLIIFYSTTNKKKNSKKH